MRDADGQEWPDWRPVDLTAMNGEKWIVTDGAYVGVGWWHKREGGWIDCDGIFVTMYLPFPPPPNPSAGPGDGG